MMKYNLPEGCLFEDSCWVYENFIGLTLLFDFKRDNMIMVNEVSQHCK